VHVQPVETPTGTGDYRSRPFKSFPARQYVALILAVAAGWPLGVRAADPIKLHPDNPHYLLWRGKPTVLIGSTEHYGAVLNRPFDHKRYLARLQADGLNLTRVFSGAYCEPAGAFKIAANTLSPAPGDLLCPWARSDTPGYANGGNKFDLNRWDPQYFQRLADFVTEAGRCGIVVEMVLFCPFYEDGMWQLSPMNAANNVNGVGRAPRTEVYTLKHKDLLTAQEAMVRRMVEALKDFDNVYYEVCNEPYFGGVAEDWQDLIVRTIVDAERGSASTHLIARNIANKSRKVEKPNPHISILNFHYAKPPTAVVENYALDRAIADDETGFAGEDRIKPYRLEGWDFIMAGGAIYDNLDYSFTVGHEEGTAEVNAPGGGGPTLRKQLVTLRRFIEGFDFVQMRPDDSIIGGNLPKGVTVRALSRFGQAYAIYINGPGLTELTVELPRGQYKAEWINTQAGDIDKAESFTCARGGHTLRAPAYVDDVALRIVSLRTQRKSLLFNSDFEDGDLRGWEVSGNAPTVTREVARAGRYAMKTSLDRYKDRCSYRTEVSGPSAEIGKEYWYGFSIFLPDDYIPDRIWEIVAQWHAVPDFKQGEQWRNPVLALSTTGGRWGWVTRWDAKRNTFESGKRQYGGQREFDLGPYQRNVWTDWVVHVRWSYKSDGFLQVWKNGEKVIDQTGPNAFNDAKGPFFKMGLYKGWQKPEVRDDAVTKRVLYHDEFRMAGPDATYEDVSPGS
jgi:hypothetical protein